uniref:Aurora kinase n=1 Tax=Panagrellus redivivus TaxID=6233 RepID=A0A7E4ZZV1_PANRE
MDGPKHHHHNHRHLDGLRGVSKPTTERRHKPKLATVPLETPPRAPVQPSSTAVLRQYGFTTYSKWQLGCGHYSKVYKAIHKEKEVAIKVIQIDQVERIFREKFLPRELNCWQVVRHPNICELFSSFEANNGKLLCMIMEYCSAGDLLSHIQRHGPLSRTRAQRWMRSLLDAVHYLHKRKIAHRDIKAENVLISASNKVKLSDFGFACTMNTVQRSTTYCGSRAYSSPQILSAQPYDIYKNDVWSLGALCFVVLTNTMPFREDGQNNSQIIAQQARRGYSWPQNIAYDVVRSVDSMMTYDEGARPTARECKKLPFFKEYAHDEPSTTAMAFGGGNAYYNGAYDSYGVGVVS